MKRCSPDSQTQNKIIAEKEQQVPHSQMRNLICLKDRKKVHTSIKERKDGAINTVGEPCSL